MLYCLQSELSYRSYSAHLRHLSLPAPLTDRERTLNAIKADEEKQRNDSESRQPRSMLHGMMGAGMGGAGAGAKGAGMAWSDEAKIAVEALATTDGRRVTRVVSPILHLRMPTIGTMLI